MDNTELYQPENPTSINEEQERPDSLYFDRQKSDSTYSSSGGQSQANGLFGSSLKKVSSNILLDSEHAKNFSPEFIELYKEACRQVDNYTMRDDRLQERINSQGKVTRFNSYLKALFLSFLPILITGFETFSQSKYIVSCTKGGVEQPLSTCVSCNGNSYIYDIKMTYNILLYIYWCFVVAFYYLLFFCMLRQSKFIMSMFSFQIKIIGNTMSAFKQHWIGFSLYTLLLCLAIILNKIVRLYADQENQTATCSDNTSVKLTITGDNYTTAQYVTSLILTILFSIGSYKMLIRLAVEPSHSYLSSQKIFHTPYATDTAYIIQQISKITRELDYSVFCRVVKETAAQVKVTYQLPFVNEYIREAILVVSVLKINKDKLFQS